MKLSKKFKEKVKSRILAILCVVSFVICFVAMDKFINIKSDESKSYMQIKGAEETVSDYDASQISLTSSSANNQQFNKHVLLHSSFEDTTPKDDVLGEEYTVNGNIVTTTANKLNGNQSCYFSGSAGQRLILSRDSLNFGTSDFTVEFWAYAEEQVMPYAVGFSDEGNYSLQFMFTDNEIGANISLVGNAYQRMINTGKKYIANEWVKYRIERKEGIFYVYENDVIIGVSSNYTTMPVNLSTLAIGGNASTSNTAFKGYIDDFTIYDVAISNIEVELNYRNEYIKVGDTLDIDVTKANKVSLYEEDDNVNQSDWTWKSSNEDVATINNNGIVTGKGVGYTTITGYNEAKELKAKAIIHVYRNKEGAITVPKVENGNDFTMVLKEDGTIWASGLNSSGQLGDGTTTNSNVPVQVKIDENTYLTNIIDISVGPDYAAALSKDGYVYAWGNNAYGQLGQGNTANLYYATKMKGANAEGELSNIIQVSAGTAEIFVLCANGEVYGSGYGANNQYLDGITSQHNSTTKVNGISNVISINIGACNPFATLSNGETWGWGHNPYGGLGNGKTETTSSTKYLIGDDISEISSSGYSTIILKEDGTIWTSGYNNCGQLGLGDTTNRLVFEETNLSKNGVRGKYVSMQGFASMVLGKDGKVYGAGLNTSGQLSQGTQINSSEFMPILDSDRAEITDCLILSTKGNANGETTQKSISIIKNDGTVCLAGDNTYGQIGNGSNISTNYLTKLGVTEIELNVRNEYIKIGENIDIDVLKASEFNVFIQDTQNQTDWTWKSSNEDVASIDANGIVIGKSIGYTTITGYNTKNGLKAKAIINVYRNKEGAITTPQVLASEGYTIILKEDGTVWSAGINSVGQLSDGSTINRNYFDQVRIDESTCLTNIIKIVSTRNSILALTKDGEIYGWGLNPYGLLGIGSTSTSYYAQKVKGVNSEGYLQNVIDIALSWDSAFAIDKDGNLYGWGIGDQNSLLGAATTYVPILIDKEVISVKTGSNDVGAIYENGDTYLWGHNGYGSVGNGSTSIGASKYYIGNAINQIELGGYSGYLLNEDGTILVSGYNNVGQLGLGDTNNRLTYTKLILEDGTAVKAKVISAGTKGLQYIGFDNIVYVTGYNGYGQLSNGITENSTRPIAMLKSNGDKVSNVIGISRGTSYYNTNSTDSAVIYNDGTVWLSGDNTYGQIGNQTNTSTLYLTQAGTATVKLNIKNEYIKINDTIDIDVIEASAFNVFIQETLEQTDWIWKSSNEDVANINSNGVVTGKTIGHTTITGYNNKLGLKAKAVINVYRNKEGAITIPQVENGDNFTVILKEDGTVWTSGLNNYGQLGDGTTTNKISPVQVKTDENTYLTNIIQISAGPDSACALTKDGYVYAWGYNGYGLLGQGNTTSLSYATKMKGVNGIGELSNVIQISEGRHEIFALTENGEMYGSGYGAHNQYLDGIASQHNTTTKVKGISNVVFIEVGVCNPFAILANGETWAWGHNPKGELGNGTTASASPTRYLISNEFNDVSTNGKTTIAIKEDGTVWTTGQNQYGQLGLGDTSNRTVFTQTLLSSEDGVKAKYVNMGEFVGLVLGKDGKLYTSGVNNYGQLSQGNTTNSSKFIPMLNSDGTEVTDCLLVTTTGSTYEDNIEKNTSVIRKDGTVWMSGNNAYGQYGDASTHTRYFLTMYGESNVELNVKNEYMKIGETLDIDVLNAGGFNVFVQDEMKQEDWIWNSYNEDVASIDNNGIVTAKSIGYTTISGYNNKLGLTAKAIINVYNNKEGAVTVPQVQYGDSFNVILKEDGTVWASGANTSGQLGNGTWKHSNILTQVKINEDTYLTNVKKISTGIEYTIALTNDGKVYTWGQNNYGKLAQGNTSNYNYATQAKIDETTYMENVIDIIAGDAHSVALTKDGIVYVAGHNYWYQNMTTGRESTTVYFKATTLKNAIKVEAGYSNCVAMLSNGDVYAWGYNQYGALETQGNPTLGYVIAKDIVDIKLNGYSTVLLNKQGEIYTTGYNNVGQLGLGDYTNRSSLTKVEIPTTEKVKYIDGSSSNTTFMTQSGAIYITGYNGYGQLCDGTTTNSNKFVTLKNQSGTDVTDSMMLAGLGENSNYNTSSRGIMVLRKDGTVWGEGYNEYGQLGNMTNTTTNYLTKIGTNEVILNIKNEYLKVDESLDINVLSASGFNVFIQEKPQQNDWTWVSSNEDVATIDDNGVVTGKSVGHTTITGNNSKLGLKAKAIINVYRNVDGSITVPKVENGDHFTVVLKEDGTVWTSGYNNVGQLGNGTTVNSNIPAQVKIDENTYLTNVIEISAGPDSACALTKDGYVYAWGSNEYGNLGQGNTTNLSYATRMKGLKGEGYLENIIQISQGRHEIFALTANGEIYGSGSGGSHNTYLDGISGHTSTTKVESISNCVFIEMGVCDAFAILSNGDTLGWGHNPCGELGSGTTETASPTKYLIGNDFNNISTNGKSSIAIKEDGTIWTTGQNNYGQLGLGDTTNRTTFTQILLSSEDGIKAKYVNMGEFVGIILGKDGKLYVSGVNNYGQLSQGNTTNSNKFIPMLNSDGTEVTDCLLLTTTGSTYENNIEKNTSIIKKDGTVWLSGENTYGQIGNATNTNVSYLTKMGDGFLNYPDKVLVMGVNESKNINSNLFSLEDDMNVFTDASTKLGDISYTVEDDTIAEITESGVITGKVQGNTKIKVLDSVTGATTNILVKVVNDENIKINLGNRFTVALKQDGTLWSWGENHVGQLGLGNTTYYNEPQKITGITEKIVDVKSGYYHSIALTENGEVYTWGYNYYGQLGNGNTQNSVTPIKLSSLGNVTKIDAYKYMTIILNDAGEVYVWGNGYGATPKKLNFSRKVIDIAGNIVLEENRRAYDLNETTSYGRDLIKISAGENHYLALDANGEVYAWGTNNYGQLGNGNNTSSNIPTKVVTPDGTANISDIVEISAGDHYSIISDKDGNIYTFGHNAYNRLASGDTRNTPLKIENISKTELVAASEGAHTAIVDWDGYVYTAGLNDAGQLGLKDNTQRATFEMVGELQIECEPEKIEMHVGENKDISLSLSSSFNLKSDKQNNGEINKVIINETIASISGNTVTANSIGKTILNASYEGTIGSINTDVKKFYRSIEVEVLPEGGIVVPKVDSGNEFTVSLKADGTVWTWGQNQYGQLGLGDTTNYNEPQKVSIIKETITNPDGTKTYLEDTIKDIAVGNYHVLALAQSGRVYSWGLGNYGQLGVGNGYTYYSPMVVTDIYGTELTDIIKIESNGNTSFAINSKGIAYAWGNGYSSRAQKLDAVNNIIDVTSKYVLSGDGKVSSILTKEDVPIFGKIVELDEGANHTVMLTSEGKAYAIGDNTYGQLGNGNNVSSTNETVAVRANESELFTGIKEIRAGNNTTVLVTTDGEVYAFGMNDNYELGTDDKDILDYNLPIKVSDFDDAIMCAIGDNHVSVACADGTVYNWGNGTNGQLGNRKNKNSVIPVMVGDFIVRTDKNHLAMTVGETEIIEGEVEYFNLITNEIKEINYISKDASVSSVVTNADVNSGKYTAEITANKVGTTIITANQVGASNVGVIQVEVLQPECKQTGIVIEPDVKTKGSNTISLRADGKVFTWGDNTYGQLGNGTTKSSDEPTQVKFPEGTIITQVDIGEEYAVALDSNGNVWTWGRNNYYQIGHSGGDQYTPYKVGGLPKAIKVAAGNYTTMIISEDKELYGWGFNSYGNLGIGNYNNKVLVSKIVGFGDVIDISGGKNHFMALTSDGNVYVAGSNLYGQLGINSTELFKANEFTKVQLSEIVGNLGASDLANSVVTVDGYVYSWGSNNYGQLGTGDKETKYSPKIITELGNIRAIEVGKTNSIARDGNGKVYITGSNNFGQLGIGSTGSSTSTTTYVENTKIDEVLRASTGDTYTTFLRKDGFVWACGDYNHGDQTKKSITNSKVPTLVGSDATSLDELEIVLQKSEVKSIMANAKFKFNLIYIENNDMSHFKFESYNSDIAEIDNDGDILGKREGTTWVKAIDTNNGNINIAIIRVIDNNQDYETHVAPKVVSGEDFGIGLKEDGTVWIWGYDDSGLAYSNIPASTNILATYKDVDAGANFAVALRSNGTVWVIGDNSYGQLGQGNTVAKPKFIQVEGLEDIVQVVAGDTHTVAVDSYGIVYGWGSNAKGELGAENINQDTTTPTIISIPNEKVMQISAGKNQTAFVTNSGKVYGMGSFLNGYVKDTNGVIIEDAVKVEVGNGYLLILRQDGSIYKYQIGILTRVSGVQDAIDISVLNKTNMYQSLDEKAYTWGVNTSGQCGTNSISSGIALPTLVAENGENVFRIGSGYNNTFTILNTGFVYGAGTNLNGELGNGTSQDANSITYQGSSVHTLVGDRNFEVKPTSNTLEINEVEDLVIESNTFNVFSNKNKDLSEFTWESEDNSIVSVLNDGEIQAVNLGTTNIVVTDPITNVSKSVVRAVVPVDTDRIESISANGKEAEVTDSFTYEVKIPLNDDEMTATVLIKTKMGTDQISIDDGVTWSYGSNTIVIDIPGDTVTLPFKVKTEAGNELNYTLTVVRLSNNNGLENPGITVKKAGTSSFVPATQTAENSKIYEVVVPSSGINVIKVTAEDANATVSINGLSGTLKEQTYNLVMSGDIKEIPVKVTSASGKEEEYTIMAYTNKYVTTLNSIFVNGIEAIKVDGNNYEAIINDLINISEVKAITNISSSKVKIGNSDSEVHQSIRNITTIGDVTTVEIYVENSEGDLSETYSLEIKKQRTQSWINLGKLKVNEVEIEEENGVYKAYVNYDVEQANIEITASDTDYFIKLGNFDEEQYQIAKTVDLEEGENIYKILVKDSVSEEVKEYTLYIYRGKAPATDPDNPDPDEPTFPIDTEVGIKNVYATNGNIVNQGVQTGDSSYKIKVIDTNTTTNLTIDSINPTALVSIDGHDFKAKTDTQPIELVEKETDVNVVIKTEDGVKEETYTVKIVKCSDNTDVFVKVDEYPNDANNELISAVQSTNNDVYEVQLNNPVDIIDVIATTADSNAYIKIEQNNYSKANDTLKNLSLVTSETSLTVTVKSEYGTVKQYTVIIKTLPEDISLSSVVIDGKYSAVYNPATEKYEVRVPSSYTEYPVKATANDNLATVKINSNEGSIGYNESTITTKTTIIEVIAQNGLDSKLYTLEIQDKSNNSEIGTIKVNGVEVTPDENGNYETNVKHTVSDLSIFGQSQDQYAEIAIDGETAHKNNITISRQMTHDSETYVIYVEAEEGGITTKTLTVNRLSGNTEIESVVVETPDSNSNTVVQNEDGSYYCKIRRNDTATVTVTLLDSTATVSVAGGSNSEEITLLNDKTQVNIVATAEDGTTKTAILTIEKESNDVTLKSFTANNTTNDADKFSPIVSNVTSSKFEVKVDSRVTKLDISAITNHELAKLKLTSESNYVVNKMLNKIVDIDGISSFTIDVLPECGGTAKEYTVEITRAFSTNIKKITTDDEDTKLSNKLYTGWIDANDNIANIVITPDNENAYIKLYKDADVIAEGVGELVYADPEVTGNMAIYKIEVSNPDGAESSEYILSVVKKSQNNNVEHVKLNGVSLTEQDGVYETVVGTANNYTLKVKAEDEYATIKFGDADYSESNESELKLDLNPGETKEIKFIVKSQNGDESEEHTVRIYRQDNNLEIAVLNVNGQDVLSSYNASIKTYNIVLENTLTETSLEMILNSNLTNIETTIDGLDYSTDGTLLVNNISLPGVGKTVITFTLTAEDGTTDTRKIVISQFSDDVELEKVEINGVVATQRADKDYEVTVGDSNPNATIYAKASTEQAKVSISNSNAQVGSATTYLPNILIAGTTFQVPIEVIAEDGTSYDYTLYVTVKSGEKSLEYVKVNGNEVTTKIDDNTYRVFVLENETVVPVEIKSKGEFATVTTIINGIDQSGNPLEFNKLLTEERNYVEFIVTSESGETDEYILEIFKESSDNTLKEVYANGELLTKNEETGRYYYSILEGDANPKIKAIANNEFAYVRIALFAEDTNISEHVVTMSGSKITTIPITIRSQTGVSNVEYLDIETIYASSGVETVIVDEREVTNYNQSTRTYTAIVDPKTNPHEIFIISENSYAKMEINGSMDDGSITTYTSLAEDEYETSLQLKITSETGVEEEYTIKLVKMSDNVKISKLVVNDVVLTPDNDDGTIYRKSVKRLAEKAKVQVITEYPYATVRIADNVVQTGTSEVWVDLDLLEEVITIPVLVTATDGETIATYNIILTRASNSCNAVVSYDDAVLEKDDENKYHIDILDNVESGKIRVVTESEEAQVDINNTGVFEIKTKEYELTINKDTAGRTVEVPIKVIAEDGTEAVSTLVITRISTDYATQKVERVITSEGTQSFKQATLDSDGTFVLNVPETLTEIDLRITANCENATITRGIESTTGVLNLTGIALQNKITYVTYKITAEAGNSYNDTYTVKIVKQSSDASIAKLKVDGNEIQPDKNGVYNAEVVGGTTEAIVDIILTSDAATIELSGSSAVAVLNKKVQTDNTYTIKVTAEDGTIKSYTLNITKQTNIAGKILTEHFEGKHKSTVYVFKTSDKKDEDLENYLLPDNSVNPNVRQVIDKVETEDDGSFIVKLQAVDKYDILVVKQGYLNYRVTDIEVTKGEKIDLDEYSLIAGDIIKTDEIEIDDLVTLNDSFGVTITDANKPTNGICDLNEDGIVNSLDRNILKTNYGKTAETVKWTNPNAMALMMSIDEGIEAQSIESVDKQGEADLKKDYILPMTCDYVISSNYGNRVHPVTGETKLHSGIDIVGTHHTQILSVADGEVTYAGVQSGYGNCIEIKHTVNGVTVYSFYAHLSQIDVSLGDIVSQGDVIGLEGGAESDPNHGTSTGHHLHFEIRSASGSGNSLDPNEYIKF